MTPVDPPSPDADSPSEEPASPAASRDDWTWRVADRALNDDLGLLYEPGNWGDVLKGAWALAVADVLGTLHARSGRPVRCLDPFAGAPSYPLVDAVRDRVARLGASGSGDAWAEAQAPSVAAGRVASTATLVRDRFEQLGVGIELTVFDAAQERRQQWAAENATVLAIDCGVEAFASGSGLGDVDFVLIDPYDFFTAWQRMLPPLLQIAERVPVLVYLYNKAPRGGSHGRNYAALRRRLERRGAAECLIGRVPSDAILPRAFHEMLLLAPPAIAAQARPTVLAATQRLAAHLAADGAFEDLGANA